MEPEPEPERQHSLPLEGVPPRAGGAPATLDRQSTAGLIASLTTHLMGEVGISYRKAAEDYAARLFEEGYDSPVALAEVTLEELAEAYAWKVGHVAQMKAWREKKVGQGAGPEHERELPEAGAECQPEPGSLVVKVHAGLGVDDTPLLIPGGVSLVVSEVDQRSTAWANICTRVGKTLPDWTVTRVKRFGVRNLWQQYQVAVNSLASGGRDPHARLLFHGTPNPMVIVFGGVEGVIDAFADGEAGFKQSKTRTGAYSAQHCAVYFAEHAHYTAKILPGTAPQRAPRGAEYLDVILAEVALGDSKNYGSSRPEPKPTEPPPNPVTGGRYDSITGTEGGGEERRQYAVFNGARAYPHYVVRMVPPIPLGNQAHTVSGWVRFPSGKFSGPRQWLLRLGQATSGSLHWLWSGSTNIQFGRWDGGSVNAAQIRALPENVLDAEEHAIVTAFDGSVLRLFVDGELVGEKNHSFDIKTTDLVVSKTSIQSVHPYGRTVGSEAKFGGTIRNVRVQPGALSAEQVRAHFVSGSS
jgi:hypothetical protein